jgi:hypothetical protein
MKKLFEIQGTVRKTKSVEKIFVIAETVADALVEANTFADNCIDMYNEKDINKDWG